MGRVRLPVGAPLVQDHDDCRLNWMREHGVWTARDDAVVIARYGPDALDGHRWCCVERLWEKR
ncbi:hypothetical protein [Mycolicibacterium pyrenivorans]|uniref:hypothetical protein n=1 Tax=Mycolicibacterium pyrenivorans TaxID=187102 RepID=UPI0021F290C8|nr:hypothetical protein [Mycolicibacterium pyrenivorans]MCV7150535.1 hypothetical protein [Mycolicibacterium pyrenivorans]